MLASNPFDPEQAVRFGTLSDVGAHSHYPRTDEGGLGSSLAILAASALIAIGYVIGAFATASVADVPTTAGGPTILRAVASPAAGDFRLAPGNQEPASFGR